MLHHKNQEPVGAVRMRGFKRGDARAFADLCRGLQNISTDLLLHSKKTGANFGETFLPSAPRHLTHSKTIQARSPLISAQMTWNDSFSGREKEFDIAFHFTTSASLLQVSSHISYNESAPCRQSSRLSSQNRWQPPSARSYKGTIGNAHSPLVERRRHPPKLQSVRIKQDPEVAVMADGS